MGLGAVPAGHPLWLHVLGMHGSYAANVAVNEADLVIALGVRFDDRVTGNVAEFIKHGQIIHIDIDRNEINKNKVVTLGVSADLGIAMAQLLAAVKPGECGAWRAYLDDLKRRHALVARQQDTLAGPAAIALLSDMTAGEALVTVGVKYSDLPLQTARIQQVVVRQKLEIFTLGHIQATVPVALRSHIIFIPQVDQARVVIALDDGRCVVRRAVVDHDQLEITKTLCQNRFDGRTDCCATAIGRNTHRHFGRWQFHILMPKN